MWFKNLAIFKCSEAFTLSPTELEEKLQAMQFKPCGKHQEFSLGWTSPLGRGSSVLLHSNSGYMMLCLQKEEKVLPSQVVNEMVAEKIAEIEEQEARKLPKKERTALKDEIIFNLLPQAFSFSRKTYAYIDVHAGWIIIDSASSNKAEDLLSLLRKSIGSLPVTPIAVNDPASRVMTEWLQQAQAPSDILIEDECELRASDQDEGGIIRCKRQDLSQPEIKNHLEKGKKVIKLAVQWRDRLSFIVDENLAIKRLRFLDMIQDQMDDIETQDAQQEFDAQFAIMTHELAEFLPRLVEIFGGAKNQQI